MNIKNTVDKVKLISDLKEIHRELFEVYTGIFNFKYTNNDEFKLFIDNEYKDNGVIDEDKKAWSDNFCNRASYTLLNKILFVRICEDKGFMLNDEDYIAGQEKDSTIGKKLSKTGFQKWNNIVTNYTLGELVKFAFNDMKKSYSNIILYKEDKYEILNPTDEELAFKYVGENEKLKRLILTFEKVLEDVIERLDTNKFDFKYADGNILGDVYEKFMDRETRKAIGQFYTPEFVIEYILKNTVEEADVIENPFVTVADISCGSGHFLIMAYDILKNKFSNSLGMLKEKYAEEVYKIKKNGVVIEVTGKEYWVKENMHYHILKHCLYGADLDSFAVQLTTINLLLKDLDNFTDELNIIECDSLIKWEKDYDWIYLKEQLKEKFEVIVTTQSNLFGEEEKIEIQQEKEKYILRHKNKFEIENQEMINIEKANEMIMLCEFWSNKFNYIIGNPPYVRQEKICNKDYLKENYNVFNSRADLLVYFIERVLNKVALDGKVGIIVSDKFTRANYGIKIRELVTERYKINIFKEKYCERNSIFDDACVDTVTLVITNEIPKIDSIILVNDTENFLQRNLDSNVWSFSGSLELSIKEKMDKIGEKIKNIDKISLNYGFKTGFNQAFIIDNKTKEQICNEDPNSINIIKPLLRGRDIDKYKVGWQGLWIIVSKFGFYKKIDEYPAIKKYLCQFEEKLKNRGQCKYSRSSKINLYKEYEGQHHWIELDNNPTDDYIDLFENDKIIYAEMSILNQFYYDCDRFYSNDTTFIMSSKTLNLKYLSGLLNSKLILFYFKSISSKLGANGRRYKKIFVNEIPIVINSKYEGEIEKYIDILREEEPLFEGIGLDDYINFEEKFIEIKARKQDAQNKIDTIVYKMFDIQQDEIQYIENSLLNSNIDVKEVNSITTFYEEKEIVKELTLEKFIELVYINKNSLEDISNKHGYSLEYLSKVRKDYLKLIPINQRYKLYNIDKLYTYINNYLLELCQNNTFDEFQKFLTLNNIVSKITSLGLDINTIMEVNRIKSETIKLSDILKEVINTNSYTWNAYRKNIGKDKVNKPFIKYYDINYYGLSEWSDEIHKKYFMDAIKEYTTNNLNEKKANDILNLFKDLEIKDKEDYIDIIEGKINKAFK